MKYAYTKDAYIKNAYTYAIDLLERGSAPLGKCCSNILTCYLHWTVPTTEECGGGWKCLSYASRRRSAFNRCAYPEPAKLFLMYVVFMARFFHHLHFLLPAIYLLTDLLPEFQLPGFFYYVQISLHTCTSKYLNFTFLAIEGMFYLKNSFI